MKFYQAAFTVALFVFSLPRGGWAGGVVTNCTEPDLRAALVGGGSVTFDCDGTIFLTDSLVITNATSISATGRNITLSGSNSVRVLIVNPGVDLALSFIKVQGGKASYGAGLLNNGGNVTANNCDFSFNTAAGTNGLPYVTYTNLATAGGPAFGGAVFNTGSFEASNSVFRGNLTAGGDAGSGTNASDIPYPSYLSGASGGTAYGGAIYSSSDILLVGCEITNNMARGGNGTETSYLAAYYSGGPGGQAFGGAIFSTAGLTLIDCGLTGNSANGGGGGTAWYQNGDGGYGGPANGGAISASNSVVLKGCTLKRNAATGGDGGGGRWYGFGGPATGGAVHHLVGILSLTNCELSLNRAVCGINRALRPGGLRGAATGGAISGEGTTVFQSVIISSNSAVGSYGHGGGVALFGPSLVSSSRFRGNSAAGDLVATYFCAPGGEGCGGAIYNAGALSINTTLLDSNSCIGGSNICSSAGGSAFGGGIYSPGSLDVHACTLAGNLAAGGKGGGPGVGAYSVGGDGLGGGIFSSTGVCTVVNSTFNGNLARGGFAPYNYGGNGMGGGLFRASTNDALVLTHCTIAGNQCVGGPGGAQLSGHEYYYATNGVGLAGGIGQTGTNSFALTNTIVSKNLPSDIAGGVASLSNLVGGEPRLAPLANNGGPTPTMGLYPDSPAINAGVTLVGVTNDQRGFVRPVGAGPDIGAFEWNNDSFYTRFELRDLSSSNSVWQVRVVGPPSQTFRLQTSSSFVNWSDVLTNTTDSLGLRPLTNLPPQPGQNTVFYRTISP